MNKKITLLLPILLLLGACSQSQQTEKNPTETQPTGLTPIKCQWSGTYITPLECNTMPPEKKAYILASKQNDNDYSDTYLDSIKQGGVCTLYRIEQQEKIEHDLVAGGEQDLLDKNSQGYNPYVYYMCKEDFEAIQPTLRNGKNIYHFTGEVVFPKKLGNTFNIQLPVEEKKKNIYLYNGYLQTVHFKLREVVKITPPTKE